MKEISGGTLRVVVTPVCYNEKGKIEGTMIGRNFAYKPIVLKTSDVILGNIYNVKVTDVHTTYLSAKIFE